MLYYIYFCNPLPHKLLGLERKDIYYLITLEGQVLSIAYLGLLSQGSSQATVKVLSEATILPTGADSASRLTLCCWEDSGPCGLLDRAFSTWE